MQAKDCILLRQHLSEHSIFAGGIKGGVVAVLHGEATVDVQAWHEVGLVGLGVFQALADQRTAALGQQ